MIYYNVKSKSELESEMEIVKRSNVAMEKNFNLEDLTFPCNIAIEQKWENRKVVKVILVSIDNFIRDNHYHRSIDINTDFLYKEMDVVLSSFNDNERGIKVVNFERIRINGISYNKDNEAVSFRTNIGEVVGEHIVAYKLP